MNKVSWIQLSDLHFGDDSSYSRKSREAFQMFVSEEFKSRKLDYIFVTGDIIFAKSLSQKKKRTKAYKEAADYLKKIYDIVWGSEKMGQMISDRIFIVPGNHDLVRDNARRGSIQSLLKEYANGNAGKIDSSYLENTRKALNDYRIFYKSIAGNDNVKKLNGNMHYVTETDKINILHINTCIASGDDGDDGKLIIGFELLNKALDSIKNDKPIIAIAHHNFDCFNKEEQKKLEILLKEKKVFLYLCGHAHERESNLILRFNQKKILNTYTCGTLMAGDEGNTPIDTVFFHGELNTDSCSGLIRSYIWNLAHGWHEDKEFGLVQNRADHYRTFDMSDIFGGNRVSLEFEGKSGVVAKIVTHQSPDRQITFQEMNKRAEESLSIYGVGITNATRNSELFDKILDKGGIVQLCMVHPEVFRPQSCMVSGDTQDRNKSCSLDSMNFCIYADHIEQYIRKEYYDEIQRSYKRILDYRDSKRDSAGTFQIKLLKSFIPISINIINEGMAEAELIIEYNMPFTEKRLLLQLSKRDNMDSYVQIKEIFDIIWNKAGEI